MITLNLDITQEELDALVEALCNRNPKYQPTRVDKATMEEFPQTREEFALAKWMKYAINERDTYQLEQKFEETKLTHEEAVKDKVSPTLTIKQQQVN